MEIKKVLRKHLVYRGLIVLEAGLEPAQLQ